MKVKILGLEIDLDMRPESFYLITENGDQPLDIVEDKDNGIKVDWQRVADGAVDGIIEEKYRNKPLVYGISTRLLPQCESFRIDRGGDGELRIRALTSAGNGYLALASTPVWLRVMQVAET